MNKKDLISQLAEQQTLSISESARVLDVFFNSIADALIQGKRVELRGLCTFQIRSYQGYEGRNPRTGEAVSVKTKKLPFFKPGTDLKQRVND